MTDYDKVLMCLMQAYDYQINITLRPEDIKPLLIELGESDFVNEVDARVS